MNKYLDQLVVNSNAASTAMGSGLTNSVDLSTASVLKAVEAVEALNFAWEQLGVGAGKLETLIVDSTQLAARVETLGVAVKVVGQNAGYTSTQVDGFEKSITSMNITTQAARQGMLYMGEALIDFSKGSQLARVAQDAAVIGNINSSDAFERLVNAIQRAEPRMLRSLGISLSFEQAYVREAAAIGKTEQQLTDYEKSQIRVDEVLQVGARLAGTYEESMSTVGKLMNSLPRVLEQIQLAFGNIFLEGFNNFYKEFFKAIEGIQTALEDTANAPALKNLQDAIGILGEKVTEDIEALADGFEKLLGLDTSSFSATVDGITKQLLILATLPDIVAEWRKASQEAKVAATNTVSIGDVLGSSITMGPVGPAIQLGGRAFGLDINAQVKELQNQALSALTGVVVPAGSSIIEQAAGIGPQGSVESLKDRLTKAIDDMNKMSISDLTTNATGQSPFVRAMQDNVDAIVASEKEVKRLQAGDVAAEAEHADSIDGIRTKLANDVVGMEQDEADQLSKIDKDARQKQTDIWTKYSEDVAKINLQNNQKIEDAQTKLNDDLAKAQQDYTRKQEDIQTDYSRKVADLGVGYNQNTMADQVKLNDDLIQADLDLSRKRESIWVDYGRKIADIQLKTSQDVADAATSYNRDVADLATKQQTDEAQAKIDHANKMADIERDYQRKILQIQSDYAYDSEELIRQRDAIGFLDRQRQLERDLAAAATSRDQSSQDENTSSAQDAQDRQQKADDDRAQFASSISRSSTIFRRNFSANRMPRPSPEMKI